MAGKRLLDAAKLVNASTNVAKQHFGLRRQQWDVYTQTSSLAKALKNQTDRVTVTAAAAAELAKRFSETGPAWQQRGQAQQTQYRAPSGGEAPESQSQGDSFDIKHPAAARDAVEDARQRLDQEADTVDATREQAMRAEGTQGKGQAERSQQHAKLDQPDEGFEMKDHSAVREAAQEAGKRVGRSTGAEKATRDQALQADLSQAEARDDGTLSSLRKRELQRQAERQIPAATADESNQQPTGGQDTFSVRSEHVSPELSSLPRARIPKHTEDAPDAGGALLSNDLNQDTFPAPRTGGAEAEPESAEIKLFTSPRVSRMLGRTNVDRENPFAGRQKLPPKPLPEMAAAREQWEKEKAESAKPEALPTATSTDADAETQSLAESIAQQAATQTETANADVSNQTAYELRESRVPSSRFGRLWQYGGLATSMAFGAVGESLRRVTGGGDGGSLMLSEGNMNRLVAKLSRMRGAALKLGQMISFQDSKVLPPAINAVLQRVQDSADYMPASQRDQVLIQNLGQDWRDLFSSFEEKPFAAASIGQVHKATLKSNSKDVAVKIQYPGVRDSIDSDLNNLSLLLTASRLLPKGMFLDRTIANARTELGWECDYEREAKSCQRFRDLLQDEQTTFAVPEVFAEASGPGVLTAEFMHGTAVTKMKSLTQHDRDWVGTQILRLCLRELMEWRFMQTDPNWTNFLYNQQTQKLELLDFGASREFPDEFVEPYVELLIAAQQNDREACKNLSIQLGYLTGAETPAMLKAHVDSILTLAEPFVATAPVAYDFEDQTITDRVRANIGLMLKERLAPPPEETYSLHRKLSGAFLLCARLKSKVETRQMFAEAVEVWRGRARKVGDPSKG